MLTVWRVRLGLLGLRAARGFLVLLDRLARPALPGSEEKRAQQVLAAQQAPPAPAALGVLPEHGGSRDPKDRQAQHAPPDTARPPSACTNAHPKPSP